MGGMEEVRDKSKEAKGRDVRRRRGKSGRG